MWYAPVLPAICLSVVISVGQTVPAVGQPPAVASNASLAYPGAPRSSALSAPATVAAGCLSAAPELKGLVQRMWERSLTFRRQCARLAQARVTVVVGLDLKIDRYKMNAITHLDIRDGLVRAATTQLRLPEAEYLAHEIEHVLEQVDGVDVRGSASLGLDGVRETHAGTFETARAIAVGRLVAQELAPVGR